jgi:hypothetical protein
MSRHTVRGLAAGFLLSLALGACAAGDPTGLDAQGTPADRLPEVTTTNPVHHHDHQGGVQDPAGKAPEKVTGPTVPTQPKVDPPRTLRFATPEGAMRYLAAAYNRHDVTALKHVTNPVARQSLDAMRAMAENLRLVGCERNAERGDYLCEFTHDYPASAHLKGRGSAHFTAAPADRVGWYMTVLNDCS